MGLLLLGVGQVFTRVPVPPWSEYWYGLCWTGFILAVDAWTYRRAGHSLLVDRPAEAAFMAAVSAATWWAFEAANVALLQSWSYSASPDTPLWLQRVRSTWFFATLTPATWVALVAALSVLPPRRAPSLRVTRPRLVAMVVAGVACGVSARWIPALSLPLTLAALVLVLDPLNHARGRPSLVGALARGDARLALALVASSLASGLLGEFWNSHAAPKWTYHVPWIGFAYVFEMPLLGYLGYPMLALALFVIHHAVRGLVPWRARTPDDDDPVALTGLR